MFIGDVPCSNFSFTNDGGRLLCVYGPLDFWLPFLAFCYIQYSFYSPPSSLAVGPNPVDLFAILVVSASHCSPSVASWC